MNHSDISPLFKKTYLKDCFILIWIWDIIFDLDFCISVLQISVSSPRNVLLLINTSRIPTKVMMATHKTTDRFASLYVLLFWQTFIFIVILSALPAPQMHCYLYGDAKNMCDVVLNDCTGNISPKSCMILAITFAQEMFPID